MLLQKEINYQSARLVYEVTGEGPAIVLLHGFAEDASLWNEITGQCTGYQYIVPHLPGSGLSDPIGDMSMPSLAGSVKAILDAEKIDRCVLIGHSMGGYITLAFADQFPEHLYGFGLFQSTAYADSEEKKAMRQKGIQFINSHGAAAFLKTSVPNLFSATTKAQNPALLTQHLERISHFSADALIAYYQAMIDRPGTTRVLKGSSVPVLFVLGVHDTAVPLQDGLQQCHLPAVSYVKLLTASAHMGMLEEPQKSNEAIHNFLNLLSIPQATRS